jgi:hypothetical protein
LPTRWMGRRLLPVAMLSSTMAMSDQMVAAARLRPGPHGETTG